MLPHYLHLNLLAFLESEISQKKEYKTNNRNTKNKNVNDLKTFYVII